MVSYFPYLKERMGFIFVFPPLREKSGPTDGAEYIHRLHLGTRAACTQCVINSFLFFFFFKGKEYVPQQGSKVLAYAEEV